MRKWLLVAAAVAVGAFLTLKAVWATTAPAPVYLPADAVVKVIVTNGHGSGVVYRDRYIITAHHVVSKVGEASIKTIDGKTRKATVMWSNAAYDLALLKMDEDLPSARLDCRTAQPGEVITAPGNPLGVEFITAYGKIAGSARQLGPWKSVLVTDITTVMGQSGGPVFDENGNVIGITVGVMTAPLGGLSFSLVRFGYAVPSSAVCELLARA